MEVCMYGYGISQQKRDISINGKLTQNHGSVILQLEIKGSKLVPCQT